MEMPAMLIGLVGRSGDLDPCHPDARRHAPRRIMLKAGIVGLPNVGKSTLFNAVTRTRKAQAANYPFCTIDPNVGIVTVPDERMYVLQKIAKTNVVIPAAIEFVDIAGLVKGASAGEGLGNKFLTHIREVDAIVQVVRCFEDADIHHVAGTVDPIRDIETITTELVLADMESVRKRLQSVAKDAKRGDKQALIEETVLKKLEPHLDAGKPALTLELSPEDKLTVFRARKIQRFLSQPFHVAEVFTGTKGEYVPVAETIKGFKEILEGKHDDVPEANFYMKGGISAVAKS